jgi:hypothetical protein
MHKIKRSVESESGRIENAFFHVARCPSALISQRVATPGRKQSVETIWPSASTVIGIAKWDSPKTPNSKKAVIPKVKMVFANMLLKAII